MSSIYTFIKFGKIKILSKVERDKKKCDFFEFRHLQSTYYIFLANAGYLRFSVYQSHKMAVLIVPKYLVLQLILRLTEILPD